MPKRNPRLRLFIRLDASRNPIPGSSILRYRIPRGQGLWVDITDCAAICCQTTTTSSTTTTTTTV
jgi:hypothetical protein